MLLDRAYAVAVDLGHGYVGQEHLVAAMVASADVEVARALSAIGVGIASLLDRLSTHLQPIERTESIVPGWSPRAVRAINLGRREAGDVRPDVRHLILGVIAEGEGLGASIFAHSGVSLHGARDQLGSS